MEYVEFEVEELPKALLAEQPEIYDMNSAVIQAKGVQNIRVQNLAITIDKVVHLLNKMKTIEPPILPLSEQEVFMQIWVLGKSLKSQLQSVIDCLALEVKGTSQADLISQIQNILNEQITTPNETTEAYTEANNKIREKFLLISDIIRQVKAGSVNTIHLSDTLFLHGYTKSYFTSNSNYQKIISTEVQVRACDVTGEKKVVGEITAEEQARPIYTGVKEYESSFVWGQLAGWFKQTVDKPNASLSSERRGTLSYPDLDSLVNINKLKQIKKTVITYSSKRNAAKVYNYDEVGDDSDIGGEKKKTKKTKKDGAYPMGVLNQKNVK